MTNKFGITFSIPHLEYLGLNVKNSLDEALKFKFSHIRIGTYWNRIEKVQGRFDFSELDLILSGCEKAEQPVILSLGVKAPRWPEFHWPNWVKNKNPKDKKTQEQILQFIKETVTVTKKYKYITQWQAENEPLDPSGPNQLSIPYNFLDKELSLIKKLDPRPVIVTLWGNELVKRGYYREIEKIADIIGIDLYFKQFMHELFGKSLYSGPVQSIKRLDLLLKSCSKPIWITELQAEPWEKDIKTYLSEKTPSMSPEILEENIKKVQNLPVQEILLWGFEYWLYKAKNGNLNYFEKVAKLTSSALI